jgi:ABC transport system ATP-binding/permease protein
LESYLTSFDGVLIIVSHDRAFADKVTDHLFVFEGDGEIKDFIGTLSEYASTLVELETQSISGGSNESKEEMEEKRANFKEDKAKRNEERNKIRRAKKDIDNIEKSIEKLKAKASDLQKEIDSSSDEGWSVLADLSDKLGKINEEIEEKELVWMELAEILEEAEIEV